MAQGLLGGVLPAIYSGADQLKRGVYGLLTNPTEQAERAAQSLLQSRAERQALMGQAFANPDRPFQVTDRNAMAQLGTDVLTGELGIAPVGMIAYHGSPFKFDKFDMAKVNKGEGSQAYGYGMYFAEAPDVAKSYATKNLQMKTLEGTRDSAKIGLSMAEDVLSGKVPRPTDMQGNPIPDEWFKNQINRYKEEIKQIEQDLIPLGKSLYKVDIPDEKIPNMLDWNRPLREQPEIIKTLGIDVNRYEKLKAQRNAMPEKFDIDIPEELTQYNIARELDKEINAIGLDKSGKKYYEDLIKVYGSEKAISNALEQKGIKGIKYLDANSRDVGKGTSNFVVFDPTDVKILERNDKPLEGLLD